MICAFSGHVYDMWLLSAVRLHLRLCSSKRAVCRGGSFRGTCKQLGARIEIRSVCFRNLPSHDSPDLRSRVGMFSCSSGSVTLQVTPLEGATLEHEAAGPQG